MRPGPTVLAVLPLLALLGCAAQVVPAVADVRWAAAQWPGTTSDDLAHGRDLFVARCSSCHALPDPDVKEPEAWTAVVGEMADRARLSEADRTLVAHYLGAASAQTRSSGG